MQTWINGRSGGADDEYGVDQKSKPLPNNQENRNKSH